MTQPIVSVRDLRFSYTKDSEAFSLHVPALRVFPSEVLALVGPNGGGKTTLLHLVMAMLVPDCGEITYCTPDGESYVLDARRWPSPPVLGRLHNRLMGFVPQGEYQMQNLHALENVELPLIVRGAHKRDIRAETERLVREIGLPADVDHRSAGQASGGQKQRLTLARALRHAPVLLGVDEPTSALDAAGARLIFDLLREQASRHGRAVVLVTHSLTEAARYADRIVVVRRGRLHFLFDDPDEPGGPALPPLRPVAGKPHLVRRDDDDARRVAGQLLDAMDDTAGEEKPPVSLTQPTAPSQEQPGRLRFSLGQSLHIGVRENCSRSQLLLRSVVALFVASAVAAFALLLDLGEGVVTHLRRQLPRDDMMTNTIRVTPKIDPHASAVIDASARQGLQRLGGLKDASFFQFLSGIDFQDAPAGQPNPDCLPLAATNPRLSAVSVAAGDAHLRPLSDGEEGLGAVYLRGQPFAPQDNDRAGVIVTLRWLREQYWRQQESPSGRASDPPFPTYLTLLLTPHKGSKEIPGWNGVVRVPVCGVIEYGAKELRDHGDSLHDVYMPEGFLRRLAIWQDAWPFLYQTTEGKPLADNVSLVTQIHVRIAQARDSDWAKRDWVRNLARHAFRALPEDEDGELVLRLNPEASFNHRADAAHARRRLEPLVRQLVARGLGKAEVRITATTPSTHLCPALPPLEKCPELCSAAVLRFRDLDDVLPAAEQIKAEHPGLEGYVRYGAHISRFQGARFLVEQGTRGLQIAFAAGLLFVLGTLTYLHVSAKAVEVGVLRMQGVPPSAIARLYFVQIALLILPACLLGLVAAFTAASLADGTVASRVLPDASSQNAPPVFLSQQTGLAGAAWAAGRTLALVLLILAVMSFFAVWLVKRKSIAESFRAAS